VKQISMSPSPSGEAVKGLTVARPSVVVTKPGALTAADREFLPAALELIETPPSPVRIASIWLICGGFAIAMAGAWIGKLDIYAVAQGRIHPSGRSKVVQPFEAGRVVGINVVNGAKVAAADVLLELDPTESIADRDTQSQELEAARAEMARRGTAIAAARDDISKPLPIPFADGLDAHVRKREAGTLAAELAQLGAARASLLAQTAEQHAVRMRLVNSIAAREKLLALAKERSDMRETLSQQGALSRALVIDSTQQYESQVVTQVGERGQLLETEAAIKRLAAKVDEAVSQFIADQTQKMGDAERKTERLTQELIKATSKSDRTRLRAPIAGTVQQLAVTSVGQVVSPGQALMTIVPNDGPLEIEVLIQNQDIGFVNEGQLAVVKVEAFPFTRYGTIEGNVTKVSRDAVDEREATQLGDTNGAIRQQSSATAAAAGRGQSTVYPATISLSRRTILVDGKLMPLSPGMSVSVEIKTGERRAIDYLLAPLTEVVAGAARDR
jgi:hemolysin D